MDNDTRNLLIGIGQPDFPYRRYDNADGEALLAKWPLLERIAGHAAFRTTALAGGRKAPGGIGGGHGSFLTAYDTGRPVAAEGAVDVRSLLGRLAGDQA